MDFCIYLCRRPVAKTGEVFAMVVIAYGWSDARQLAAMDHGTEGYEVWLDTDIWCTENLGRAAHGSKEGVVLRSVAV